MPTLAQQRAAIRAGVSSSRAATGEAERRATGSRIEAERRGESVVEDLNRLITPTQQRRTLRTVQPVGALPPARGRGVYVAPPATGAGGGVASQFTEVELDGFGDREFWPAMIQETTDGLLAFEVRPIKKWKFLDAIGGPVDLNIAKPPVIV
ncbi:hypothetical protein [Pseudomonas leptonychotis]|uniref:hypothetical protein n=1 Tax=Pseudomonas leptonychotis TaxID=2448482 RepID=UPI00386D1248